MANIGIIMGSDSDWPVMEPGYKQLKDLGLSAEVLVASAHRTPEDVREFVVQGEEKGFQVFIAAAGAAAHLPGVVASFTTRPVIGVPISGSTLKGVDALLSIVQMPPGIPVATMAIDGGRNAALMAAAIISLGDEELAARLKAFRADQARAVKAKNAALQTRLGGE